MSRPDRLMKILKMLHGNRPVARDEFLSRLEVSLATLKRDMEYLRDQQNVPIAWSREHRGYVLAKEQSAGETREPIPGTWFDRRELLGLLAIQQMLDQIEPRLLQDALRPLRERLSTMLGATGVDGDELRRALTRIRVLPMHRRPIDETVFERVVSALTTRQRLQVRSTDRRSAEQTDREISPQRLVRYRDNWYLDAWCHLRRALRTFALDNLANVRANKGTAIDVDEETLREHFEDGYGIFAGKADQLAVLRFDATVVSWVRNERWHPHQVSRSMPDGSLELSIPYRNPTELIRDVLRWGHEVEVIAPASLRAQVGEVAKKLAKRYATAISR